MLKELLELIEILEESNCQHCENNDLYLSVMYCEEHSIDNYTDCKTNGLETECSVFGSKSADDDNSCTWQEYDVVRYEDGKIFLVNNHYEFNPEHEVALRCTECGMRVDG